MGKEKQYITSLIESRLCIHSIVLGKSRGFLPLSKNSFRMEDKRFHQPMDYERNYLKAFQT
jgi:hypothetical protein